MEKHVYKMFNNEINHCMSRAAAGYHPGSFSFVMAAGIVSLAAFQHGMEMIAYVLFVVNTIAYAALAAVTVIRGLFSPSDLRADMTTPSRVPALFTITAGTRILGSQSIILAANFRAGIALWIAGLFFWTILSYVFFAIVIVRRDKTAGEGEVSGEWLIYVAGTQALAILTIQLVPDLVPWQDDLALVEFKPLLLPCLI
jgi:tellurite resistance protein TehA-like permease